MSFYVGCYLVLQDSLEPRGDHDGWAFPTTVGQHMSDTSNVEDLLIDPDEMTNIPTQIQYGGTLWSIDEGFVPDYNYDTFYVKTQEHFYVQGFTPGTALYSEFYVKTQEHFYVRGWTSGTDLYSEFYVKTQEHFYVRGWTSASDLYDTFYVKTQEHFYVQGFTPVDFFYPIAWTIC